MCAGSKMTTKKTTKKKITTPSTCLQKTQTVILRKSRAIGKPGEEFSLHLSRGLFRLTRRTVSSLVLWTSDCVSLYPSSNMGIRSSGWLAHALASFIAYSMKSSFAIEIITASLSSAVTVVVVTIIKKPQCA